LSGKTVSGRNIVCCVSEKKTKGYVTLREEIFAEFNFTDEQVPSKNFAHFDPHFSEEKSQIS